MLRKNAVLAYPTDTLYGLGCCVDSRKGIDALSRIVGKEKSTTFSFLCRDFQQADEYARISREAFRIMKHSLPGPCTFILPATSLVPKRIVAKRKTVGIRIPDHAVCQALIREIGCPLANASLDVGEGTWAGDAYSVESIVGHQVAAVIEGGICEADPSTVVDLTGDEPIVRRQGKGAVVLV